MAHGSYLVSGRTLKDYMTVSAAAVVPSLAHTALGCTSAVAEIAAAHRILLQSSCSAATAGLGIHLAAAARVHHPDTDHSSAAALHTAVVAVRTGPDNLHFALAGSSHIDHMSPDWAAVVADSLPDSTTSLLVIPRPC